MKKFKYTEEMRIFVKNNVYGIGNRELTELFNKQFNVNITKGQIKSYKSNYHITSGVTGQFKKGNIPHNKGQKGVCAKGCEKTWFKKGDVPANHRVVGSERIRKDGYIEIKTKDPNVWTLKQRLIWENEHGIIPKNHTIIFLDENNGNFDINNLKLISRSELLIMNQNKMFSGNAEITDCNSNIAKLMTTISKIKKANY